jgi:hypothetical protein
MKRDPIMLQRLLCFALLIALALCAAGAQSRDQIRAFTDDQALSAVRASYNNVPDAALVVAFKVKTDPTAAAVAAKSLAEAQSNHVELYDDGLRLNLMRSGGYLVLEFNKKSNVANKLYVVTSDTTGATVVEPRDIDGGILKDDALAVINKAAKFSKAFFDSSESQMDELLVRFGPSDATTLGFPGGVGYLAIPEDLRSLTKQPKDLFHMISLCNGLALWTIRHALADPMYAANPIAAVQRADDELAKLEGQFQGRQGNKGDLSLVDDMIDLNSIHTREDLKARLQYLARLSAFLDEHSPLPVRSPIYKANVSISTVPLELAKEQVADSHYGAVTGPGLISGWRYTASGELVLIGLSVAE